MSRLPGRAGRLGLVAAVLLLALGASPATAVSVLPTPPSLLPLPSPSSILPTPTPLPTILPLPTANPGSIIETAPTVVALSPSTTTTDPAGVSAPAPGAEPYQPSPDEQASLPDEPNRVAYEQQQQQVSEFNAEMQKELGAIALEAGGGSGQFAWPVVVARGERVPLTQRFGCTDVPGEPYHGDCPTKRWHTGIDLALPMGTPVFAADAGVARTFRSGTGYGNYVMVVHGNGYATLYGHLSDFAVQDGQVLKKGDQVGFLGSSGFSTGPHLHFEIRYDKDYVDPCAELKC